MAASLEALEMCVSIAIIQGVRRKVSRGEAWPSVGMGGKEDESAGIVSVLLRDDKAGRSLPACLLPPVPEIC